MLFLWGSDSVLLRWAGVGVLGWCCVPGTLAAQRVRKRVCNDPRGMSSGGSWSELGGLGEQQRSAAC